MIYAMICYQYLVKNYRNESTTTKPVDEDGGSIDDETEPYLCTMTSVIVGQHSASVVAPYCVTVEIINDQV